MVNIQDFRFMWQGKPIAPLLPQQASLLAPIDIRGAGRDRALLLLHGFSSSPAVFRAMVPELTMYDAVVCPVLPGHAENKTVFAQAKAADWISMAEETCNSLLQEYTSVDVLGLSLGGLLACHLSQRFILNHLYLLAPALLMQMNVSASLLLARVLHTLGFKWIQNRAGDIHTWAYQELTSRQVPIAAIIEILTLINNFKFVPPDCPTDLFLGRYDKVCSSTHLAERFASLPDVNIHWLDNSAHVLPLDGDIDAIVKCIKLNHELLN